MLRKVFTVAVIGALSCIFVDAAFAAGAELGYDPFKYFMSEEALAALTEIPEGCHQHGPTLHCGADAPLSVEW